MPDLLIIDDDHDLFELLENYLREEGFASHSALSSEAGLNALGTQSFDAVILDVMLPGMNGFELLRRIRAHEATKTLPVLMLTAKGEEVDRVVGLEMGADDYLGKPFSPRELVARLRAILRRSGGALDAPPRPQTVIDGITINHSLLCLTVNGEHTDMTMQELRLLDLLIKTPGVAVNRDALCRKVFGHPAHPLDRSLDMLVSRLRKKLGPRPDGGERIKAIRGEGYVYLSRGGPR